MTCFPTWGRRGRSSRTTGSRGPVTTGALATISTTAWSARVSTKGTDLEADLKTYRVRRTASRDRGPRAWLTEWYLNAHDGGLLYPRSVEREFKETYRRDRAYPEEKSVFEG